ncbi:MAG: hypothetical protein QME81_19740, partial [bacterium]|nr:hypothetical protein [bacterium]
MRAVLCVSNERSGHSVQQAEKQRLDFVEKLSRVQNDDEMVCGYYENFLRRHDKDSVGIWGSPGVGKTTLASKVV